MIAAGAPNVHELRGPCQDAMRDAQASGYAAGERDGYTLGWRIGLLCGTTAAAFGSALAVLVLKHFAVL